MVEKLVRIFWDKELGTYAVDGKELYEGLKIPKTTKFTKFAESQLNIVEAIENIDYRKGVFKNTLSKTKQNETKYTIALDTAKEICMVVGAAPRTNKETKKISKEIRQYFIESEKLLNKKQREQLEQLLEEKRNRTVTVHERNIISSSVNFKADESKNSRDEAKKIKNFIFDKYGIKSYGEIKQVDIPTVLQIVNKWEVSDRKNNLFNLIG